MVLIVPVIIMTIAMITMNEVILLFDEGIQLISINRIIIPNFINYLVIRLKYLKVRR
jgi:hypothetical protein